MTMQSPPSTRFRSGIVLAGSALAALVLLLAPISAAAQEAKIAFGGLQQDTGLPVNIESESFEVDNTDGTAVFIDKVRVAQGEMRLAADRVRVEYTPGGGGIHRLHATGNVMVASPTDAAEAREAVYTIADGMITMTGDVLLTQGATAISGQKLVINLKTGTGAMSGGVRTTFTPSNSGTGGN